VSDVVGGLFNLFDEHGPGEYPAFYHYPIAKDDPVGEDEGGVEYGADNETRPKCSICKDPNYSLESSRCVTCRMLTVNSKTRE